MSRWKLFVASVLLTCLLTGLCGFGAAAAKKDPKDVVVAVLLPFVGEPYFQTKWYGYSDEAKKLGVKAILYDAGGYQNIQKQISQIEDVTQRKVDAIIFHPCASEASVPAIEEAIKAGIKVVNDNQPCPSKMIQCRVMRDFYLIGKLVALGVVDGLNGKGKVILLPGAVGAEQNIQYYNGQMDTFKRFPGIKVVGEQWCPSDSASTMRAAEDLLQAHPDVNAITTWATLPTVGVVQALKAAGKKPGEVVICSFNFEKEMQDLIRQGWVYQVAVGEPVEMARTSMRFAVKMALGEAVPAMWYTNEVVVRKNTMDLIDYSSLEVPEGWVK